MTDYSKYIIYVDESGDANWKANPAFPLLCLNFCLFKKEYYLNTLIPAFNALKFKYWGCDNIVFHERDFRKPDKIRDPSIKAKYETLKGQKKSAFMAELSELMEQAQFSCFSIILDKDAVPDKYKVYDLYHIALSRGFRQITHYLKQHAPHEVGKDLHFIFEKRGYTDDLSLSTAYKKILLDGTLGEHNSAYDFSYFRLELVDKKANSTGLQFADLTARPIGNHYLSSIGKLLKTDQRAIAILKKKLLYCSPTETIIEECDIFHQRIQKRQKRAEAR